jgi:hypothetical protein
MVKRVREEPCEESGRYRCKCHLLPPLNPFGRFVPQLHLFFISVNKLLCDYLPNPVLAAFVKNDNLIVAVLRSRPVLAYQAGRINPVTSELSVLWFFGAAC